MKNRTWISAIAALVFSSVAAMALIGPPYGSTLGGVIAAITDLQTIVSGGITTSSGGNVASGATDSGNPVKIGCVYNSTQPTVTNGQRVDCQETARGGLIVATGVDALAATGNVAAGSADSGNPIKVGGVNTTTLPTLTDGQRGNLQLGTRGDLHVSIFNPDTATAMLFSANNADGVGTSGTASRVTVVAQPYAFNGSTWDRQFTCASTATISVTTGNTTQLVALASSQVIRVCSFVLTESLAGTAKFVYGTGSNCGTGTTDITAAMVLPTNGSIAISSPGTGMSLFRTAASNALCLTSATGTITGFVTYTQF